ncbi:MAG: hypothetical protein WA347_02125 [Rhabdochlamydiaceae bacterium]|jgi:hypothetical protein
MSGVFYDNSVITEVRSQREEKELSERAAFLREIHDKYLLNPERGIITNKQFVEIISSDKPRKLIISGFSNEIVKKRDEFKQIISQKKAIEHEFLLKEYSELQNKFRLGFLKKFPQESISSLTHKSLRKDKFDRSLFWLEKAVLRYGKKLAKNTALYLDFIETLVNDSVIRVFLSLLNCSVISPEFYDYAKRTMENMCGLLIKTSKSNRSLDVNLPCVMASLVKNANAILKPGEAFEPLLRIEDDIADPDLQFFPFFGISVNKTRYPVTVFTTESINRVRERLRVCTAGLVEVGRNLPGGLVLIRGRTIVVDFPNKNYVVIGTEEYL